MRTIVLFPLTLVAVIAGCGSEVSQQATRSVPERDLTLVTHTSEVKIASPVETQQPKPAARLARAPRSRPLAPKVKLADPWTPRPIPVASQPVAHPVNSAATPEEGASPANDRELLPGKTVTLIPASSGPSTSPDQIDDLPEARGRTMVTRGGGTCRGRGRGPAPRPDFR
jgi:hypothetical protein